MLRTLTAFFTLQKFRQIFLKIKRLGPPFRDMPRHKLEGSSLYSLYYTGTFFYLRIQFQIILPEF